MIKDTFTTTTNIVDNIVDSIGHTPLIRLQNLFPESTARFFGKLEAANPSGSLKDRTSKFIVQRAISEGFLREGDTIIESSSGNMALGLAQACIHYKLKLIVVVDPNLNPHTEKLLNAYGATIDFVKTPLTKGGFLAARLQRVQELLDEHPNSYWTNQYGNKNNPLAHHQTINEIMDDMHGDVDYLFVAASTCGTLMGYADFIQENNIKTKLVAVDAMGSVLFGGASRKRLIPGHGAGVASQFLDTEKIWDHVEVSDLDCVEGCWSLLKKEGILCGGSTGGVITAMDTYTTQLEPSANCVLLLSDRGERYLDTIYNLDWVNEKFPAAHYSKNSSIGW
ncbi:2,3-diaminopropionate biosynthesis protein SbnA [Pareuzebyella sediminis]|uniref:2,3-diaminopropionate biosynthesis protein SbnA n=1 Tax=Pareuzebyella sediminis TaxID=2607998 RepID=UPI0011EDE4EC|nr:2,3-diaminopropionate biosynthesis protein SbnA [Pareuzebyella sediminis]